MEWINTPASEAETRAAEEEWRSLAAGDVSESGRWIAARAAELHRNGLVKSFEETVAFIRERARLDPCYALLNPVLGAAREETKDPNLSPWHQQAARKFLDTASDGDELARRALGDASGVDRLARLLQPYAAKAWRIVTDVVTGNPEPWSALRHRATRAIETPSGPAHWADAGFAKLLRTIGPTGEEAASLVLRKSAERLAKLDLPLSESDPFPWTGDRAQRDEWWERVEKAGAAELVHEAGLGAACWDLWLHEDSHPRIYDYLAWTLWGDKLRPSLAHEARNPPSLVIEVHEDVTRVHSQVVRLEESNGQRALVFDGSDRFILVPSVAEEMAQALVERGVGKLGTVTAHRALRWQLTTAHERAIRGEPDARVLTIDGGWSVYAYEKLKLKSKAEAENLKAITYAQDAVHVTLPDGSRERMLNLREWPAQGRRPGRIQQTLGTMLLPHYVFELGLTGRRLREAQRLIPVCALPPFVGRNRDHGPQATLSMLVVRELRTKARELAKDGAVRITRERWVEMARESALPPTLLGRVIDRWVQDGPDAPAFLARVSSDAYTLAAVHSRELAFILASGHTENRAVEAGKQSVRARQGKMRRLGRGKA